VEDNWNFKKSSVIYAFYKAIIGMGIKCYSYMYWKEQLLVEFVTMNCGT
jgi:hypothetical protein